jgi:ATP-dependent Lon protease
LKDVPDNYKKKVRFHPVKTLFEVLNIAFSDNGGKSKILTPKL